MYRKLDALRGLPIVAAARRRRCRRRACATSPGEGRVSTIEAIARALRLLEGDDVAAPLEALFAVAVERAQSTGRTSGSG